MPYRRLADFLTVLAEAGELVRIRDEVDPYLELAEIVAQTTQSAGLSPALLFENVRGSSWPVVANLLGSESRLLRALGTASLDEAACRLRDKVLPGLPSGWSAVLQHVAKLNDVSGALPRPVKAAACQQVVQIGTDVDLQALPVPQFWEGESGPTITAGQLWMKSIDGTRLSVGRPRLQPTGARSLVVHWHAQHEAAAILEEYRRREQQLPVAITLGGNPLWTCIAGAPLPGLVDPLWLSGLLSGEGAEIVKARTVDLDVPAEAELVIEGYVDASAPANGSGVAASAANLLLERHDLPTIHVTALTHRANPAFPVLVPTSPPSEEHQFLKLTERLLLPFLRIGIPELVDLHLPLSTSGRLLFVSIRKQFPRQVRQVIDAICSLRAFLPVKLAVIVDADLDVRDDRQVWRAVAEHVDPQVDAWSSSTPGDLEDPACATPGIGTRLVIDATRKWSAERPGRPLVIAGRNSAELQQRVAERLRSMGLPPPVP